MELLEKVWPEWQIEGELGEGSFGKVYKIKRQDIGGTYLAALKVIRIPKDKNEINSIMTEGMMDKASATHYFQGMVEEIVKEFAMMEKLKGNTNIVTYEDHRVIAHEDGLGWDILIRMELLTPLTDYMAENTLGEKDAIKLGIDICRALELCQKYNIIHRDIKPENIFISEIGDYKLGDFGVARTAEKTTSGMSKKGTYTYMAPEVYKGDAYNATVDLYSLGIVLYRLVNNYRTPFLPPAPQMISFSDKDTAQSRRMSGEELPAPSQGSEALTAIIRKACAFNPKERYADATQMRIALEGLLTSQIVPPAPVMEEDPFDKTVAMSTSVVANTMTTETKEEKVVTPVVAMEQEDKTVSMAAQPVVQPVVEQKEAPTNAKKRSKVGLFAGIGVAAVALIVGGVLLLGGGKDGGNKVSQGGDKQVSTSGDNKQDTVGDAPVDVVEEEMNILTTKLGVDETGMLYTPEGAEAMSHNNRVYHPISMLGWWVPEDPTYDYSDCENFHPAKGSRIVIGEGEEGPLEVECLPIYLDLKPIYLTENANDVDIEDANLDGMYYVDARFMENHSDENKICEDVQIAGFYDTHEDTLALGFESTMDSENVVNIQETHYKISWTGWKLTLTYGDYSMTYVPWDMSADRESLGGKDYWVLGGYIEGYTPIKGLGEKFECQVFSSKEDTYKGKVVHYDPELFIQDATVQCKEDGTIIIDTMEESSSDYRYPAEHFELKYRSSQEAITLISEDGITVYSEYSNPYWDYIESLVGDDVDDSMTEEQVNQIVENKNTILQKLKEAFDAAGITVSIDENTGKVAMDSSILFGHDDSTLSQEGKDFLDKFLGVYASVILSDECAGFVSEIEVEGHTDTSGAYDYNLVLSKDRADSVVNYCLQESNSGLDAAQLVTFGNMIKTVGRSYDEPVYNADGTVNMDASRRVVFRFRLSTDV